MSPENHASSTPVARQVNAYNTTPRNIAEASVMLQQLRDHLKQVTDKKAAFYDVTQGIEFTSIESAHQAADVHAAWLTPEKK